MIRVRPNCPSTIPPQFSRQILFPTPPSHLGFTNPNGQGLYSRRSLRSISRAIDEGKRANASKLSFKKKMGHHHVIRDYHVANRWGTRTPEVKDISIPLLGQQHYNTKIETKCTWCLCGSKSPNESPPDEALLDCPLRVKY
ncbi:hypothetical protein TEA_007993 [Camellia sinensis var. sinensis]|uniref:Uncharacterized protein n=1 Tax=Camellia sinensis var. sinensis TaxID=542762 RepID=A0A4S4EH66_CAMSN|nr:hypothetical protein TEA_007993 [Camellia sinensis var. sinensis]